jgi:hypothetical protein
MRGEFLLDEGAEGLTECFMIVGVEAAHGKKCY